MFGVQAVVNALYYADGVYEIHEQGLNELFSQTAFAFEAKDIIRRECVHVAVASERGKRAFAITLGFRCEEPQKLSSCH